MTKFTIFSKWVSSRGNTLSNFGRDDQCRGNGTQNEGKHQIEGFKVLQFYDIHVSGQKGQKYTKRELKIKLLRKLGSQIFCDGSLLSHKGGFTCFIDHSSWMRALCVDIWQLKMSTQPAKVVPRSFV